MDEQNVIVIGRPMWPQIVLLLSLAALAVLSWLLAKRWLEPVAYSINDQMRGPFRVKPFGRLQIEVPASMLASLAAPVERDPPVEEDVFPRAGHSAVRAADRAPWDVGGDEPPAAQPVPDAGGTAVLGNIVRGLSGFKFEAGPELRAGEFSLGEPVELADEEELRFASIKSSLVLRFYRRGRRALQGLDLEPGGSSLDDLLSERERAEP